MRLKGGKRPCPRQHAEYTNFGQLATELNYGSTRSDKLSLRLDSSFTPSEGSNIAPKLKLRLNCFDGHLVLTACNARLAGRKGSKYPTYSSLRARELKHGDKTTCANVPLLVWLLGWRGKSRFSVLDSILKHFIHKNRII